MENITLLESMLQASQKVCVVTHTHPDGDALGSAVAMQLYLSQRLGKDAAALVPDTIPQNLKFLSRGRRVTDAKADPRGAEELIREAGLIIVIDLNELHRTEQLQPLLEASPAPKILIDHHLHPDLEPFSLVFSEPERSSSCELLYYILKELEGGRVRGIPAGARTAMMAGMTTDTNNFGNSTGPDTLRMAGELIEAGVDRDGLLDRLYHRERPERIYAQADMVARHMSVLPGGIAVMVMDTAMQRAYRLREGETESLVNVPLNMGRIKMSIFARQEGDIFRISIRSKRGWSARTMAAEYFHGGGHELAAGGKIFTGSDVPDAAGVPAYLESVAARFLRSKTAQTK